MTGYLKISLEEYLEIDALNNGLMSAFARSPAACKMEKDSGPKDPTPTMILGSAVHAALLEPDLFAAKYAPIVYDGRTREGKEERERIRTENLTGLRSDDYAAAIEMARSLATHPRIGPMIQTATAVEESAIWQAPRLFMCKSRRDVVGDGWLMDVKTTASLEKFTPWQFTDLGYHRQAAWYSWGDELLGRRVDHFFFAVVQNTAPYESALFRASESAMRIGKAENEELMRRYEICLNSGVWPRHIVEMIDAEVSPAKAFEIEGVTK